MSTVTKTRCDAECVDCSLECSLAISSDVLARRTKMMTNWDEETTAFMAAEADAVGPDEDAEIEYDSDQEWSDHLEEISHCND